MLTCKPKYYIDLIDYFYSSQLKSHHIYLPLRSNESSILLSSYYSCVFSQLIFFTAQILQIQILFEITNFRLVHKIFHVIDWCHSIMFVMRFYRSALYRFIVFTCINIWFSNSFQNENDKILKYLMTWSEHWSFKFHKIVYNVSFSGLIKNDMQNIDHVKMSRRIRIVGWQPVGQFFQ